MPFEHARWKICKAFDGQYYVNFIARNGQVLMTSERYKKRSSAEALVRTMMKEIRTMLQTGDYPIYQELD